MREVDAVKFEAVLPLPEPARLYQRSESVNLISTGSIGRSKVEVMAPDLPVQPIASFLLP